MNQFTSPGLVSFGSSVSLPAGKKGIIKPDADGYYNGVVIGALNHYNSAGAYYPLGPAQSLFQTSSSFMRRIGSGNLRGECGHPRRFNSATDEDYMLRLRDLYEPNISHHMRRVWLEEGHRDEQGRPIILILAEIKPCGPKGAALKDELDNRFEDVCFSLRSFTVDSHFGGQWIKSIREIITFDWVNEPGISAAHKWRSPSLEGYVELDSGVMTKEAVLQLLKNPAKLKGFSLESDTNLDRLVEAMGWDGRSSVLPSGIIVPPSHRWR